MTGLPPCCRCLHCHIGSSEANTRAGDFHVDVLTRRAMREGDPSTCELPPAVWKVMRCMESAMMPKNPNAALSGKSCGRE